MKRKSGSIPGVHKEMRKQRRNNTLVPPTSRMIEPRGQEQHLEPHPMAWVPIPPPPHNGSLLLVSADCELDNDRTHHVESL